MGNKKSRAAKQTKYVSTFAVNNIWYNKFRFIRHIIRCNIHIMIPFLLILMSNELNGSWEPYMYFLNTIYLSLELFHWNSTKLFYGCKVNILIHFLLNQMWKIDIPKTDNGQSQKWKMDKSMYDIEQDMGISCLSLIVFWMMMFSECFSLRKKRNFKGKSQPWPPFKPPGEVLECYRSIYRILHCKTLHSLLFTVLQKVKFRVLQINV